MIDPLTETIIDFNNIKKNPNLIISRGPTYYEVLTEFTDPGIKNHKLETIIVDGSLCTSVEALLRFSSKVSICEFCLDMFGVECGYDDMESDDK